MRWKLSEIGEESELPLKPNFLLHRRVIKWWRLPEPPKTSTNRVWELSELKLGIERRVEEVETDEAPADTLENYGDKARPASTEVHASAG